MNRPVSLSLQSKLIRTTLWSGVIAGVIAFMLLVFLTCYHTMKVQDEIMDEVSDMLLLSDVHLPSGQQLDELSDEFDLHAVTDRHAHLAQPPARRSAAAPAHRPGRHAAAVAAGHWIAILSVRDRYR